MATRLAEFPTFHPSQGFPQQPFAVVWCNPDPAHYFLSLYAVLFSKRVAELE